MKDWGRIGRRSAPFTRRATCDTCGEPMSVPTAGATLLDQAGPHRCPLCDEGTLT